MLAGFQLRPQSADSALVNRSEGVDGKMQEKLIRKQSEFDAYARDSALANSVDSAKDVHEESMAKVIILAERERLRGLSKKI